MAIIRDIDKGNGEIFRVEITEYRGNNYLNIRTWYQDRDSGEYKPTQKGVAIRPELFQEVKEAILQAEGEINKLIGESESEG